MKDMVAQTGAFIRKNPGLVMAVLSIAFIAIGSEASANNATVADPFTQANKAITSICAKLQGAWVKALVICVVLAGAIMHIAQNRKGMGVAISGLVGLLVILGAPGLVKLVDQNATC